MKTLCKLIALLMCLFIFLTACEKEPSAKENDPQVSSAETSKQAIPESLTQLDGVSWEDIAYIEYDGDLSYPGPDYYWTSERHVISQMESFKGIRPKELLGGQGPQAGNPGRGEFMSNYKLHKFDGNVIRICFESPNGVQIDGNYYSYKQTVKDMDKDLSIFPDYHFTVFSADELSEDDMTQPNEFPKDTTYLTYQVFNATEETYQIQLMPRLEKMTEAGWENIPSNVGFCGTPTPFPPGSIQDDLDLSWYGELTSGTYRLVLDVIEDDMLYEISTLLILTD